MTERVLCIAAHPDDESLGCGGALRFHVERGDVLSVVAMADGVNSRGFSVDRMRARQKMFRDACKILGTDDAWLHQYHDNQMDAHTLLNVIKHVEKHLERFSPSIVYTHWSGDLNVDHRVVCDAVEVACRPQPGQTVRRLLYFEVPCSTTWAGGFAPNYFVPLSVELMEAKLQACRSYGEELRPWPHPRSELGIQSLAQWRGAGIGCDRAEAFLIGRIIA